MDATQVLGILGDTHGLLSAFANIARAVYGSRLEQRNIDCIRYANEKTAKQLGWRCISSKFTLPEANIWFLQLEDQFREKLAQLYGKEPDDITDAVVCIWFDFYLRKVIKNRDLSQYLALHQGAEVQEMLHRLLEENHVLLTKRGLVSPEEPSSNTIVNIKVGGNNSGSIIGGNVVFGNEYNFGSGNTFGNGNNFGSGYNNER